MDKLYDVMIAYLCQIHKLAIHRLHRALKKFKLKSQVLRQCFVSLAVCSADLQSPCSHVIGFD